MKLNQGAKKRWQLRALLVPQEYQKRPKTMLFEALGGQVGHEHVLAAHLEGEGTACSAPSEPKRVPEEDQV